MKEVLDFLTETKTFYFATVEGDKPKVRPFAFAMEFEDKLYFCTNNTKPVYSQLMVNPNFEISTTNAKMEWVRLLGKAVFDNRIEVRKAGFEAAPYLAQMYQTPENPTLSFFYLQDGEAVFSSLSGDTHTVKI